jgi:hypothetical protein
MGITQLIDPFYISLPADTYRRTPLVGQFCWIPAPHLDPIPRILEVERFRPEEHYASKFDLRNMEDKDFTKKTKLPIKMLSLRETEELIVSKAKRRPAVIVSAACTIFDDVAAELKKLGRKHLQEEDIIVLPLYEIETDEHSGGFPPVMTARIKALMYSQFFFCPKSKLGLLNDSIARLDRIQVIRPIHPTYEPKKFALSPEALGLLMAMLRLLFGGEEDKDMKALKDLAYEYAPKEARI